MSRSALRVALAAMPWSPYNRPSIQLGALKAFLEQADSRIRVTCLHPYLAAARDIGPGRYQAIARHLWVSEALFAGVAFPNIHKHVKNLETVLYSQPVVRGDTAKVGAVIVILHPLKKQEIQATFDLKKSGGTWRVVDVQVKGNPSMLTRIRDDQVQKILAKGGWAKLLSLLEKRTAKM